MENFLSGTKGFEYTHARAHILPREYFSYKTQINCPLIYKYKKYPQILYTSVQVLRILLQTSSDSNKLSVPIYMPSFVTHVKQVNQHDSTWKYHELSG